MENSLIIFIAKLCFFFFRLLDLIIFFKYFLKFSIITSASFLIAANLSFFCFFLPPKYTLGSFLSLPAMIESSVWILHPLCYPKYPTAIPFQVWSMIFLSSLAVRMNFRPGYIFSMTSIWLMVLKWALINHKLSTLAWLLGNLSFLYISKSVISWSFKFPLVSPVSKKLLFCVVPSEVIAYWLGWLSTPCFADTAATKFKVFIFQNLSIWSAVELTRVYLSFKMSSWNYSINLHYPLILRARQDPCAPFFDLSSAWKL